jgi:nicotinate-nucleotide pyrophosphorylase (carboxylating)
MEYLEQQVRRTISLAFEEDHTGQDITSLACISPQQTTRAEIVLKQNSKVAGLRFLPWACQIVDPSLTCEILASDGKDYEAHTVMARIEGKAHSILALERTALNLLQHASGIAQQTAQYVNAVKEFSCDILDTRKTLPGLRALQKYAVVMGGGKNHRFHLEDRFLIKNNHLKLQQTSHSVAEAIRRARTWKPQAQIEVEVENLADVQEALKEQVEMILLDNMTPSVVAKAVALANGKAYLEASGGITLDNVKEYAATGVNGISIGALTHSVRAVDLSLRM